MNLIEETVGEYTKKIFEKYSSREALFFLEDGRGITFKNLSNQVDIIAKSMLAIGVKKGDHVAIISCNSPEYVIVFLAILKIGAVAVCINYSSTHDEVDCQLRQSESTVLVVSDRDMIEKIDVDKFNYLKITLKMKTLFNLGSVLSKVKNILDDEMNSICKSVTPDDMAVILYTSGTTGKPKGIMLNQRSVLNGPISFIKKFNYTSKDIILATLPLNHILGGLYTVFLGLLAGSKIILMKKFKTSSALQAIESYGCTGFHGVPTMYQYLLNKCRGYDISTLRLGMIAGSVSSEDLIRDVMKGLNIKEINNAFGQTETLGVTQTIIYDGNDPKINTVGKPIEGVKLKICDVNTGKELPINSKGELYVKTPYSMMGYYNDVEETNKTMVDGWIRTGDIGFIDEDGYLSITGRFKDVIIRGGENISPSEIEQCLIKNPKINSAVVVGVDDDVYGEEIFAFIKPNVNGSLSKNEITDFLYGKISKYKFPKYIKLVDEFPLTSNGKIKRREMKEIANEIINSNILQRVAVN